jgi:hypothetical protein
MPVADELLISVRDALGSENVREVKMFGGVGFMLRGNMVVAASKRGLLVRVGPEAAPDALKRKGASAMIMNGRTMTGYISVEPSALDARAVKTWVSLGRAFVETLPPKQQEPTAKRMRTKAKGSAQANTKTKARRAP